ERGDRGWSVLDANSAPLTKPFRQREQAEKFADLVGKPVAAEVPAIWLKGLPRISAMPLYGCGAASMWFGVNS
ncbi:MAG: hypothetical protein KDI66_17845, partial [Xanthomonadales bacterium]|nr:hypothetical protein [Xanthomonadales bacterium]